MSIDRVNQPANTIKWISRPYLHDSIVDKFIIDASQHSAAYWIATMPMECLARKDYGNDNYRWTNAIKKRLKKMRSRDV